MNAHVNIPNVYSYREGKDFSIFHQVVKFPEKSFFQFKCIFRFSGDQVEFVDWDDESYRVEILRRGYATNPGRPQEEWYRIRFISGPRNRYILLYFLVFKEKFKFFLIFHSKRWYVDSILWRCIWSFEASYRWGCCKSSYYTIVSLPRLCSRRDTTVLEYESFATSLFPQASSESFWHR